MKRVCVRRPGRALVTLFAALAFLACSLSTPAQQKDKKKKKDASVTDNGSSNPIIPLTDEQQIDYLISEVLGFWQLGDSERMHKNYVEDVSVVNGGWAAPILGWSNYETLYKQQRASMQQVRLDRSNTFIKVNGATAWACYQWEFAAVVNGAPSAARGQTTYVLVKRDAHWLIAHDHTSIVQSVQKPSDNRPAQTTAPPKPGS